MTDIEKTPHIGIDEAARSRFAALCVEAAQAPRSEGDGGFGTLAEKRMHAVIKRFLCPDEDFHEVGFGDRRYVADVRLGNAVYEVQTGALRPMKAKLAYYLEQTDCTVTIVHPITVNKQIVTIDPDTGEASEPKRSPKHERADQLLSELYPLLPLLPNPRLRVRLLLIEATEYRIANARRHRGRLLPTKYELMPSALLDVLEFCTPSDYRALLPQDLPSPFTVKELSKKTGLRGRDAYSAAHVLVTLGITRSADPIGRAMAFTVV